MKKNNIIQLNKKPYQSPYAWIQADKFSVNPFEKITIKGKGFTSFKMRGNPGAAVLIDGRPLTGVKVDDKGNFKVSLKMPPFAPGKHIISVFGVETTVEVKDNGDIITGDQLMDIINRDFKVDPDCHLLLSDVKYRACPIDVLKCFLNKNDVNKKKYVAEWFDCFTPDTPVVARQDGTTDLVEIHNLKKDDYILNHSNEWTQVNWVKQKKSTKPLIQLTAENGIIALTDDHRLRVDGEYVTATHTTKNSNFDTIEYTHFDEQPFDSELAFLFGLFCADGHSSALFSHWNICNQDKKLLQRAKQTISREYPNIKFGIKLYDCFKDGTQKNIGTLRHDLYMLKVEDAAYGGIRNNIATDFDRMFYTGSGKKKIPTKILNSNKEARLKFLEGYLAGDGHNGYAQTDSKCLATGLAVICRDLPHSLRTYAKTHLYSFHYLKNHPKATNVCIATVEGTHDVYDVNCASHEFCAGPFKVHNCDDFSDALHGHFAYDTYPEGYAHGELWVETPGGGHAVNCFLIKDGDVVKLVVVEPQNDSIFDFPSNWNAFMIKI